MPPDRTSQDEEVPGESAPATIGVPGVTPWPLVLALGLALTALGMIINIAYCPLGLVMAFIAGMGFIYDLLPGNGYETKEVEPPERRADPIRPPSRAQQGKRRGLLPEETWQYKAGLLGGLLGGVAMAVLAALFGIFSGHGIWYPANLLAGVALADVSHMTTDQLEQFHGAAFVAALFIHLLLSLGLGTLYGMVLPMLPRRPLLWGALGAPAAWTAVIFGMMAVADPALAEHVNWWWFVPSQVAFGLTAGLVVRWCQPHPLPAQEHRNGRGHDGQRQGGDS